MVSVWVSRAFGFVAWRDPALDAGENLVGDVSHAVFADASREFIAASADRDFSRVVVYQENRIRFAGYMNDATSRNDVFIDRYGRAVVGFFLSASVFFTEYFDVLCEGCWCGECGRGERYGYE
jgi:hypothetical protein